MLQRQAILCSVRLAAQEPELDIQYWEAMSYNARVHSAAMRLPQSCRHYVTYGSRALENASADTMPVGDSLRDEFDRDRADVGWPSPDEAAS